MTDGITEAARAASEDGPIDASKWEEHLRARLDEEPGVQYFAVPRSYIERLLRDHEGAREVARLVEGAPAREEWSGR